jgi:hypothetical protein
MKKLDNAVRAIIEGDNPCRIDDRTMQVFDEIIEDRKKQIETK